VVLLTELSTQYFDFYFMSVFQVSDLGKLYLYMDSVRLLARIADDKPTIHFNSLADICISCLQKSQEDSVSEICLVNIVTFLGYKARI